MKVIGSSVSGILQVGSLATRISWRTRFRCLLRTWAAREFERPYLASMNDRQLWQMGLTRNDAHQIAQTPFWRP